MTYEQVKHLKPAEFKRLCGVRLETFGKMVDILAPHLRRGQRGGQPKRERRRPIANDIGILERISYLFSYGTVWERA